MDATPTGFLKFFLTMERAFIQNKFLAVASSLGHLPIKKCFRSAYHLGSKIR